MKGTEEILDLLSLPKNVALLSHRNPDGDALGSCLALANLLVKENHQCGVIFPSEFPSIFDFLPGIENVTISDEEFERATSIIERSEIIFCLDFNSLERVDKLAQHVEDSKSFKILIDHHLDPEPFADFYLSRTEASSTCELIFDFIHEVNRGDKLDKSIGECLMAGIITDTGSFKYNTNPRTYEIAASLKRLGVDDFKLQDLIYNSMSEKQLRLLGHCLKSRMEILEEYHTGIIALNKYDYRDYKIDRGDTEGIVNYLMMLKKVNVAIFIRQQPSVIKISFRSKGDFSVQEIARDHFNGGGHKNASGGFCYGSLRSALDKIKEILPAYIKKNSVAT